MEEFNLEKYNTGNYDVVTRDGKEARVLCTDKKCRVSVKPIVALVSHVSCSKNYELVQVYCQDGKIHMFEENDNDLMLIKKKWVPKEGETYWCISSTYGEAYEETNQKYDFDNAVIENGNCFKTKEEAEEMASKIRQLLKNY